MTEPQGSDEQGIAFNDQNLRRLLSIMERLRGPEPGCEWERAQTFATIAPYTIEEAYEVTDAIFQNDVNTLRDELGDLLLQIVFHARIAEEQGAFSFDDVVEAILQKLTSRHRLLANAHLDNQSAEDFWEQTKIKERHKRGMIGALDGIAHALPALMRAQKLQARARDAGFLPSVTTDLSNKIKTLGKAHDIRDKPSNQKVAGETLFAIVSLIQNHDIDAEDALRTANLEFVQRYRKMEEMAVSDGVSLNDLSITEKNGLWDAAADVSD